MPFYLTRVKGVLKLNILSRAILVFESESQFASFRELLDTEKVNLVCWLHLVVVGLVDESKREETLLLAVGFVNTSERAGDDSSTS